MQTIWKDKIDGGHSVEDGLEVRMIRRETVNEFADWQETVCSSENDAIASPETNDPVTPGPMAQREKEVCI